ncbi:MAG TPA: PDZ domain-containing protein [bacterium]|nr:PDZ domain-containing protein [bacterium]
MKTFLLFALCLSLSPAAVLVESAPSPVALSYTVELPDHYDSTKAYPLIVALHGYGDRMSAYVGTSAQFCPEGAIGLYPESPFPFEGDNGLGWTWWLWADSASGMSQQSTKQLSIDWILSCLDMVESRYAVDKRAVFLYGFSQGGMLTYEIGVRYPERFRGLIPAGGLLDFKLDSLYKFDTACRHVPLRALHGAYDDVVDFKADVASNETLRNRGMPAELLRYPAKHELTKEMMEDAHDFVEACLPSAHHQEPPIPQAPYGALRAETSLDERAKLIYELGAKRVTGSESTLTALMKDRSAPGVLRQTAYSALIKLATPTAWQATKAAPKVVCADRLVAGANGEKAGLKPDDVIISYNGKAVKKTSDLRDAISAVKPDVKDVAMVIERQGKRLTLHLPPGRVGVYLSERVK